MKEELDVLEQTVASDYKYGFVTEIDTDIVPKGLS
jgi:Fe-S cluster assembly protein SufB